MEKTEFQTWFDDNKDLESLQQLYLFYKKNDVNAPLPPKSFEEWAKTYYYTCVKED